MQGNDVAPRHLFPVPDRAEVVEVFSQAWRDAAARDRLEARRVFLVYLLVLNPEAEAA